MAPTYRGMTFCPFYTDCAAAPECRRPLTPEVAEAARRWWGGEDAPIAVYAEKPECFVDAISEALEQSDVAEP